jgi:hypothetical protein
MIAAAGLDLVEARAGAVVPPDPESLDATRPADLDVCPVCEGDQAIPVRSSDGEADAEECWACAGTGIRGAA